MSWIDDADERHLVAHATAMGGWLSAGYVDGGGERGQGRYSAAMKRLVGDGLFDPGERDRRPTYELTDAGRAWIARVSS